MLITLEDMQKSNEEFRAQMSDGNPSPLRLALHQWRIRIVFGKSEEPRLYTAFDQSFGV